MKLLRQHFTIIAISLSIGHFSVADAQSSNAEPSVSKELETKKKKSPKKRHPLTRSVTLNFNGVNTRVLEKSILYVPAHHKGKILFKPNGRYLAWDKFYQKNAGWIHPYEVKMAHAKGLEHFDPKVIEAYRRMGKVIIATYKGSPITVSEKALNPPSDTDK